MYEDFGKEGVGRVREVGVMVVSMIIGGTGGFFRFEQAVKGF